MTPLLNKLEVSFTRRNKKWERTGVPPFWAWTSPSLLLSDAEDFPVSLYVREALTQSFCATVVVFLPIIIAYGMIYKDYHSDPRTRAIFHPIFLHLLWQSCLAAADCTVLAFLLNFPGFYFWNRRAKRLRGRQDDPAPPVVPVAADPSVWPPPPNFTARP